LKTFSLFDRKCNGKRLKRPLENPIDQAEILHIISGLNSFHLRGDSPIYFLKLWNQKFSHFVLLKNSSTWFSRKSNVSKISQGVLMTMQKNLVRLVKSKDSCQIFSFKRGNTVAYLHNHNVKQPSLKISNFSLSAEGRIYSKPRP